jgi:hypothetical protein
MSAEGRFPKTQGRRTAASAYGFISSIHTLITAAAVAVAPACLAAAAPASLLPLNPAAAWSSTYLLNTLMADELEAVVEAVAGRDAPAAERFLASPTAAPLRLRAQFALTAARAKRQPLQHEAAVRQKLSGTGDRHATTSPSDAAALSSAFESERHRHAWAQLSARYTMPPPTCPLAAAEVRHYLAQQAATLAGGRAASPAELLAPLRGWDLRKKQCLVFAVMAVADRSDRAAAADPGGEPLHLMAALRQSDRALARDTALNALMALRLFELRRYDETLRILMDLQDADAAFRLPYDIVQRIYSIRQKGGGAVVLRGF